MWKFESQWTMMRDWDYIIFIETRLENDNVLKQWDTIIRSKVASFFYDFSFLSEMVVLKAVGTDLGIDIDKSIIILCIVLNSSLKALTIILRGLYKSF